MHINISKRKRSILNKILLLMILLSVISGAFVLGAAIIKQNRLIEEHLIQENKLLAKIASQTIETGYLSQQWPFEVLKQISQSEDVLFWWVVKPDGEISLADDTEMWGKKLTDPSLGTKEIIVKNSVFYKTSEKIKLIAHPLNIEDSEKQWTLYLGVSLKSLTTTKKKMIFTSLVFFVIIIILATILSIYLAKSITKPIKNLTDAANKISMGDLKVKINIKSKDEIGELAKSFNRMLRSIKILMKTHKK